MFDFIIIGLGSIIGYGPMIFIAILMTFVLLLMSRGAGITALLCLIFLLTYLLANNVIADMYFVSYGFWLTLAIVIALLIGLMIASKVTQP